MRPAKQNKKRRGNNKKEGKNGRHPKPRFIVSKHTTQLRSLRVVVVLVDIVYYNISR